MRDLIDFLRARLDEAEAAARRVRQPYRLYVDEDGRLSEPLRHTDPHGERDGEYQQWPEGDDRMPNHIATWMLAYDPARVLADVEAKRYMVDFWSAAYQNPQDSERFSGPDWDQVRRNAQWTLRLLALPYATHPDYREDWRP